MKLIAASVVGLAVTASSILATPVVWTGSSGSLAASAKFSISGADLLVTLANTSTADPSDPSQILTGVFFNITGDPTLGRVSAVLSAGSTVIHGPSPSTDPGNVVGGEWAYKNAISGPGGTSQGISSSGLGIFGGGDRFPGNNLQGPTSPDGIQYGITTAFDTVANDNGGLSDGLIKNSVDFVLSGLSTDFSLKWISDVRFQYGTALTEANVPGTPNTSVPDGGSTLALLGCALGGVEWLRRKLRQA